MNHICKNCSVSNINCKCKICKRSEELQVCIKCYFEFVEKRKTITGKFNFCYNLNIYIFILSILEISKKTIKLVQLSDDFVPDFHNFLAICQIVVIQKK